MMAGIGPRNSPKLLPCQTVGLGGCLRWDRALCFHCVCALSSLSPSRISPTLVPLVRGASHRTYSLHNWAMSAGFTVLVLRNHYVTVQNLLNILHNL